MKSAEPLGLLRPLAWLIALPCLLALLTAGAVRAMPASQSAQAGETLFTAKCAACHTIGGGTLVGPDLQGITSQRSPEWLASWIAAPDRLLAQGDPIAQEIVKQYSVQMPNLGLSQSEVASVIAYLDAQAAGTTPAVPAAPVAQMAGDPALGKEYFTGSRRLQNGGPACMACHSVAGLGALGGGALGPDLTPAFAKYGDAGLAAFLANPPTPTMNAVWATQPLTPEEQSSLHAFLQDAGVAQRPPEMVGQLVVLAIVVGLLLLGLMEFVWRRRLAGVRRPLVQRTV